MIQYLLIGSVRFIGYTPIRKLCSTISNTTSHLDRLVSLIAIMLFFNGATVRVTYAYF
jgi:hypothetical protein